MELHFVYGGGRSTGGSFPSTSTPLGKTHIFIEDLKNYGILADF